MKKESLSILAPVVYREAVRACTGKLARERMENFEINERPQVDVISMPKTKWAKKVDEVERPFAPVYDEDEYGNASLAIMGLFELKLMLSSFRVYSKNQTEYEKKPLLNKNFFVAGVGTGREIIALASLGANVVGIDATKEYVEITSTKVQNASTALGKDLSVKISQCPAEDFPYEESYYDGVSSLFGVLNHVEEWENTVNKISQSLKPNGTLVISMYGPNNALVFDKLKSGKMQYQPSILQRRTEGGILLGNSNEVLPASFPKPTAIAEALDRAGLKVQKVKGFLRISAFYPREPNENDLISYRKLVEKIDQKAAKFLSSYTNPEELLLASFLYDQQNQDNLNDFAYVAFVAKKTV